MEDSAAATPQGRWLGAVDPDVTVVVATRNRSQRLRRCIDALAVQEVQAAEVIVVDDASHDDTAAVLAEASSEPGSRLRATSRSVPGGPGGGRNTGWKLADTAYVAFTDDDCEPTPGWLREVMATARANPECLIQGPTHPNPREAAQASPVSRTLEVTSLGPWFPASNITYPLAALTSASGFDDSLERGEDTDLAWRVQKAGFGTAWSPQAVVHHAVMQLGVLGALRLSLAWSPVVSVVASHPHLRSELVLGVFWKRSHALLLLALVGSVLGLRKGGVILAVPFAAHMRPPAGSRARAYAWLPFLAVRELFEVAGMIRGSIRARFLVL